MEGNLKRNIAVVQFTTATADSNVSRAMLFCYIRVSVCLATLLSHYITC